MVAELFLWLYLWGVIVMLFVVGASEGIRREYNITQIIAIVTCWQIIIPAVYATLFFLGAAKDEKEQE